MIRTELKVSIDNGTIEPAVNIIGLVDRLIMKMIFLLEIFDNKRKFVLYTAYPIPVL